MSTRTKNPQRVEVNIPLTNPTEDFTHIQIELFFSRGGTNWMSGNAQPKGFCLSFRGVKIDTSNGFTSTSFMMFGGWSRAFLLQSAERFNARALRLLNDALNYPKLAGIFEAKDYDTLRETLKGTFSAAA